MERTSNWSTLGTEATVNDFEQLLLDAGLNYVTKAEDLFTEVDGTRIQIPNRKVILREDTKEIFGVVSDRYQICQNHDAFDFVKYIDGVELQRAGSSGSQVWMIGKLPEVTVLGDKISPNLIFQNSHDGSCSIRTTICMLRMVCQNQFIAAFGSSPATRRIVHSGDLKEKLVVAKETLHGVYEYIKSFDSYANGMVKQKISSIKFNQIVEKYFEIPEEASKRTEDFIQSRRDAFIETYNFEDNQNFKGTKWGLINAFSDFMTHEEYSRKVSQWETNRFLNNLNPSIMTNFMELVEAA